MLSQSISLELLTSIILQNKRTRMYYIDCRSKKCRFILEWNDKVYLRLLSIWLIWGIWRAGFPLTSASFNVYFQDNDLNSN